MCIYTSLTKSPLALLINFDITFGRKYEQKRSQSVLLILFLEEAKALTEDPTLKKKLSRTLLLKVVYPKLSRTLCDNYQITISMHLINNIIH